MNIIKQKVGILLSAAIAGTFIGFGGMIFLMTSNPIVGVLLFSFGLFVILSTNLHLFTEKICYLLSSNELNALDMIIIWIGNFIGAYALAFVLSFTRYVVRLEEKACDICDVKYSDSYLSLFILGMLCNVFIFIAVDVYKNSKYELGKYLAIILAVMGFILTGTEHCVADMFYFSMTRSFNIDSFTRLLIITSGNIIGGINIRTLMSIKSYLLK